MRYIATIKWLDKQEIVDDMILKIGRGVAVMVATSLGLALGIEGGMI